MPNQGNHVPEKSWDYGELPSPNAHAFPQGDGVGIRLIPQGYDVRYEALQSIHRGGGVCVEKS